MRVKLTVAYDGTSYHGWQLQPNATTIEEKLNRALTELLNENIIVIGASRTDAGVHSMGTVAVFDTNTRMPAEKIMYAVNQRLPEDIRVISSIQCADDFHPRHCKSRKTYLYRIYSAEVAQPVYRLYAYHTRYSYDVNLMQQAADSLIGEHDFTSFCSIDTAALSTIRTLYELQVTENNLMTGGKIITIRVTGNGFLYNMVRIIAGTLMEVGRCKIDPQQVQEILEQKDRSCAGPTAPACGLTLLQYEFNRIEFE